MTRRPSHVAARKPIPARLRQIIASRSGGTCEKHGCTNEAREIDHALPVAIGGTNEEWNLVHLCRPCHVRKSALDVKMIAKADRQGGRAGQYKRRKDRGRSLIPARANPWPKGRKLQSRPFNT